MTTSSTLIGDRRRAALARSDAMRRHPTRRQVPHPATPPPTAFYIITVVVTVFTMLIPGAPFLAQNYTLALIGVPFRLYIGICLPMHAARSSIAVILGGQAQHLTPGRVLLMLLYVAAILGASWWAFRRIRSTLGDRPAAASGRKQPA